MDFELSQDQSDLQDGMRSFCAGRFPMTTVRELEGVGLDKSLWRELAQMGVFALRQPESEGGVGLGWADTVLVFEELGRALVPGPLIWTHLAAGLVDGAADGTVVVGGLDRADAARLVEFPSSIDVLLVHDADGVSRIDVEAVDLETVELPLDPLTPVGLVDGELPEGERLGGPELAAELRRGEAMLAAALLLGISEASTDAAVAYAAERVQFDRPIGTFQALKHVMADMLVRTEVARAAVYAAGVTADDPEVGDLDRAVGAAKITAIEAGLGNAKTCVQVHGGMGYTWEVDAHLFLKRAYALAPAGGGADQWSEVMADHLDAVLR